MTTVVAWLALLVSAASLGWQMLVWKKSAAQVQVDLQEGSLYQDGEERQCVVVVATNVGRTATTINELGVHYHEPRAQEIFTLSDDSEVRESDLPKRLEPGEEFMRKFDASAVWWFPDFPSPERRSTRSEVVARGYVRVGRETVDALYSITLRRLRHDRGTR